MDLTGQTFVPTCGPFAGQTVRILYAAEPLTEQDGPSWLVEAPDGMQWVTTEHLIRQWQRKQEGE